MALQSDIHLDVSKFLASSISPKTSAFNEHLMDNTAKGPRLHEVGTARYRAMILAGETAIPKPTLLDAAETFQIPTRESSRSIPCRILRPPPDTPIKGVFMHLHLGGWTLCDEASQDPVLAKIAANSSMLCISIGYRLAPEHPFPAGPEDCFDAAEWLVENAQSVFGAELAFIGGESAGAHLSVLTALHLKRSEKYAAFNLKGLLLHFGVYDLSGAPHMFNFKPSRPLLIDHSTLQPQLEQFCPGRSAADMKDPRISPLYADLAGVDLPPALFTVGTQDPLLDDTVFMSVKWMMAGAETVVKIYPGASHAYLGFPEEWYPASKEVFADVKTFVDEKLG